MKLTFVTAEMDRYLISLSTRYDQYIDAMLHEIGKSLLDAIHRNLNGRILHKRSGRLYSAWDMQVTNESNVHILTVGTLREDVPYSEIQDKGGKTGRKHTTIIPAREYYSKEADNQSTAINRMIGTYLKRIVK